MIDPISIALATKIILNVFKLIQGCRKNQSEAIEVAHDPSLSDRRLLKIAIRDEVGFSKFALRKRYYDEIIKQGSETTDSEMEGLYDDYSGYATMEFNEGSDTT